MKTILASSLLTIALILSSCTVAYFPGEINTPAFHESNEFKGGISYGTSGTNLQLGYSYYKNLAAIGSVSYLSTKGNEPQFQRSWEFGLGYFNKLHKKSNVYYEVYGGFDISETRTSYEDQEFTAGPGYENARYYRIFIQPDLSFTFDAIDLVFALKLSYFRFSIYEHHSEPNPKLPRAIGFEPAFTFRIGSDNIKFKTQVGFSYVNKLSGSDFNYKEGFIYFGLAFGF
ncbi:MAG: hypothetical protein L0Y79_02975 [Chlorobi bacterium]|nr:hypothetical protein [Chlorobiota bacterium]MCI0715089.1 hypothetical protein [Chlorobiota bacterium]